MGSMIVKPVREGFDPTRPNPNPLGGRDADTCLYIAEQIDGYRTKIFNSPINRKARIGQKYKAASSPVAIPIEDAVAPWWSGQVLWLDPTADGGLPHTRPPGYICLPANIHISSLPITLLHERIHLHQKRYPAIWINFVTQNWNMVPWKGKLPEKIESARRINPDLLANPFFIWNNVWVPICLYNDTGNPSLTAASTVWYNPNLKTTSKIAPDGWTEFFGNTLGDEHPWELSAYYISDKTIKCKAKSLLLAFIPSLPTTFIY